MHLTVALGQHVWRPLTPSDADTDFVLAMRNDPRAQSAFFKGGTTREEHLRFLRLAEERDEVNWIIESEGRRVGAAGIWQIDRAHRRAMAGRVMVTRSELYILNLVVSSYVVLDHLGLNKLVGDTLSTNAIVSKALERLGGVTEGTLREHVVKDGAVLDVCLFGLLAREWRQMRPSVFAQFGTPVIVAEGAAA